MIEYSIAITRVSAYLGTRYARTRGGFSPLKQFSKRNESQNSTLSSKVALSARLNESDVSDTEGTILWEELLNKSQLECSMS